MPPRSASAFCRRAFGAPAALLSATLLLAACVGAFDPPAVQAATASWPPVWRGAPLDPPLDDAQDNGPPPFEPPSAQHCHRAPGTREVPGVDGQARAPMLMAAREAYAAAESRREREPLAAAKSAPAPATAADAVSSRAADAMSMRAAPASPLAPPQATLLPRRPPVSEVVTAGVVDDNADFGEYLAYRQRKAGLPVRERDISERYLVEVTDAQNRPVHDAEVAVQRAGAAQPLMWARTDTAGRVWLHPRAFLSAADAGERTLGIAVRQGGAQARGTLLRGQPNAVQLRLNAVVQVAARPRLDLVFLVDATGSMGDEIDKLKTSMRAMAQQIAQLPSQPDVCFGLVAYRDRGDAFLTRTHDFTDRLDAFQQMLANVHAAGGGDTPEALNEALHEVVHGLSWRADAARMVVLVADAPPHLDYGGCMEPPEAVGFGPPRGQRAGLGRPGACPQYDRDMQAALAKGIKLFAVGASGLDPVGEYIFRQIAQYTAGRFVFLTYRNAADPGSGPGAQTVHDVKQYSVQTLDALVVRLVGEEMARLRRS